MIELLLVLGIVIVVILVIILLRWMRSQQEVDDVQDPLATGDSHLADVPPPRRVEDPTQFQ